MNAASGATSDALAALSPAVIAVAIEANPVEYWRACAPHLPRVAIDDGPELFRFVTGIPFAPLNQVVSADLPVEGIDARIDETLAVFKERRAPMLWSLSPSTRPADLGSRLEGRGLANAGTMTGMAATLDALPETTPAPPDLTIDRVTDLATLDQWRHAYTAGFEMSDFEGQAFFSLYASIGLGDDAPFRHYVGLLRGQPVASSTVFLGTNAAGVWHVATVPPARRQGIGAAMTLAPMRDARSLGYRVATLYSAASGMGLGVYRQLGFAEYLTLTQYSWTPGA